MYSQKAASGWLFVLPWSLEDTGGVNHVVRRLIRYFRAGGRFSPQLLVTSLAAKAADETVPDAVKHISMDISTPLDHQHPIRALLSFVYHFPSTCRQLRHIVNQYGIRIINPQFPNLSSLMFIALKRFGQFDGKIILSFHGTDVKNAVSTTGVERHLWRILLRHADGIIVVSKSLGSELLSLEPGAENKMRTIHNGVDLEMFRYGRRVDQLRLGTNEGPTIISVGYFSAMKGHHVAVEAFSLVVRRIPNVRLILVGKDGPELQKIRQLVDILLLGERVTIFKDVPHERIPEFLSQAKLFVLASSREGHPLAVIEAGAAGLPVVCTRTSGARELISDQITGRLVEIGDKDALAEAMVDLLTHPEEAQQMATNFREYIEKNLTWGRTYAKYLQAATDGVSPEVLMAKKVKQGQEGGVR